MVLGHSDAAGASDLKAWLKTSSRHNTYAVETLNDMYSMRPGGERAAGLVRNLEFLLGRDHAHSDG